jgi:phytoene dehydrogenase-like protein
MSWTMGYLTFYIGIKCKLPEVNHHNYFLGSNYEVYANNVMKNPDTLQKPYYYVNVLSKHNDDCAPEGCESLFFVCPVPNLYFKQNWDDKEEIVNSIISDFSERIGQDIQTEIVSKTIYTPLEWRDQFNLHRGSGLGLSHSMNQIGIMRPKNVDEKYKNVFYVGASTVPGAGIPMAIISSKLAFERIEKFKGFS